MKDRYVATHTNTLHDGCLSDTTLHHVTLHLHTPIIPVTSNGHTHFISYLLFCCDLISLPCLLFISRHVVSLTESAAMPGQSYFRSPRNSNSHHSMLYSPWPADVNATRKKVKEINPPTIYQSPYPDGIDTRAQGPSNQRKEKRVNSFNPAYPTVTKPVPDQRTPDPEPEVNPISYPFPRHSIPCGPLPCVLPASMHGKKAKQTSLAGIKTRYTS